VGLLVFLLGESTERERKVSQKRHTAEYLKKLANNDEYLKKLFNNETLDEVCSSYLDKKISVMDILENKKIDSFEAIVFAGKLIPFDFQVAMCITILESVFSYVSHRFGTNIVKDISKDVDYTKAPELLRDWLAGRASKQKIEDFYFNVNADAVALKYPSSPAKSEQLLKVVINNIVWALLLDLDNIFNLRNSMISSLLFSSRTLFEIAKEEEEFDNHLIVFREVFIEILRTWRVCLK